MARSHFRRVRRHMSAWPVHRCAMLDADNENRVVFPDSVEDTVAPIVLIFRRRLT